MIAIHFHMVCVGLPVYTTWQHTWCIYSVHVHDAAVYSNTDPTAELQIARRKISELESSNKHIQDEVKYYLCLFTIESRC